MPAVLSRHAFDARLRPLYTNLILTAQKRIGANIAPDVVQDALLAAWRNVAYFAPHQGQEAFAVWLQAHLSFEIARYICAQSRHVETPLPATTIFELCDGPDAPHWEAEGWVQQREEIYRPLHAMTLTPRQRNCCLLWISGGLTLREIGALQDPPVSAVAVHKIIQRVGRLMADVDDIAAHDVVLSELIENKPAALSYAGQVQY